MNVIKTEVLDVVILEPRVFGDNRGWFMESWSQQKMEDAGLFYQFVQDNHSFSAKKGVLRGLHFQKEIPVDQSLSLRCQRTVDTDIIRFGTELVKPNPLKSFPILLPFHRAGVGNYPHAESSGNIRRFLRHMPEAHKADGLSRQFGLGRHHIRKIQTAGPVPLLDAARVLIHMVGML